jgi:hypothetical protein
MRSEHVKKDAAEPTTAARDSQSEPLNNVYQCPFSRGNGLRTHPSNPPVYALIPSNAPSACSGYVAIDIVRNAQLGFGGVQKQAPEK